MPRFRAKHVLAYAALIGLALVIYAFFVEPYWLRVRTFDLRPSATGDKIRVVQLSDLHLRHIGRRETAVVAKLQAIKPDLIVLSGDVLEHARALPVLNAFLDQLGATPKVAVLGNWDHWSGVGIHNLRTLYESRNDIRLLVNQSASYRFGSRTLYVFGLDDATAGKPDARPIAPPADQDAFLLVQHSPGWFEQAGHAKLAVTPQLCLSGHTHGGQITLFGLPIWTPRGSGGFGSGFYQTAMCTLYVSPGIGTSRIAARLGARPEIVVFDL